jgi:hypothetical protein
MFFLTKSDGRDVSVSRNHLELILKITDSE